MKKLVIFLFVLISSFTKAQKIENIFVNLYTDSLKKGTYNYINIDGLLSNGRYLPLDSTHLTFWASDGKFYGNSLFIDKNFVKDKVSIKVVLKQDPKLTKEFTMYIKTKPDDEVLKTGEEIMNEMRTGQSKKKKK